MRGAVGGEMKSIVEFGYELLFVEYHTKTLRIKKLSNLGLTHKLSQTLLTPCPLCLCGKLCSFVGWVERSEPNNYVGFRCATPNLPLTINNYFILHRCQ